MSTSHRIQAGHLHAVTRNLMMAVDTPRHIADTVTEILVKANLSGHDSHGVLRMPRYLQTIEDGGLKPAAEPTVTKETNNLLFIDGNHGFGHYTAWKGMTLAIEKARQAQVCCATFVNTGHIGRVGEYAEMAAEADCIGITTLGSGGSARSITAPFGGINGRFGTNPISVGIPTGDDVPFVLDFATSVVAEGKLQVARSKGLDVPDGYILNNEGQATTNPHDFYDGGYLLPFGGHKGSALLIMTALLGGLSGNFDLEGGSVKGEFMIVLDIKAFTPPDRYKQSVRAFLNNVKSTPPADGVDEVLAPGDFEYRTRMERLKNGIELPAMIYGQLQEWANKLDVSMGQDIVEAGDMERYT